MLVLRNKIQRTVIQDFTVLRINCYQFCNRSAVHKFQATKFCAVAPNIRGS